MADDSEEEAEEQGTCSTPSKAGAGGGQGKRGVFQRELRRMMYAFGDDPSPYQQSVEMMEELTIQYVTQLITSALEIGKPGKVQIEDIVFLLRKDRQKYARVRELLTMNEELKRARKAIEDLDAMPS